MRLGIEAKWLFRGPPSGKRVVRNLVATLAARRDVELHLFLDARDGRTPPWPDDVRRHGVWAGNNQLSNVFVVPRVADRLGLDAVVYQNFAPPAAQHARIAFVHDAIFESHPECFTWRERLYFAPLRSLAARADRVCTVSASERTRLVTYGYARADRVDVVPNAVDAAFAPRASLPAGSVEGVLAAYGITGRFVLYAGRLNARKNVDVLIRAASLLRSHDLAVVVVGAADRTCPDLRAIAAAARVTDRVRLLGAVDDATLRALYASATVFCCPSLDEGFGLTPLEAMASGAPTVVSDVPALRETCGDGALRVDPRNHAALAAAIDALADDALRRETVREAGLRRARAFTWERSADCLLAAVRTAVEARA